MRQFRPIILTVVLCFASVTSVTAQHRFLDEGWRNYRLGNYDQSINLLKKALRADSLQRNAYVLLGAAYLKQETPEVAQLTAEQGLQYFPDSGALLWLKAEAYFQQQLIEKAFAEYSRLYKRTGPEELLEPLQIGRRHIKKRLIETNKILASMAFQREELKKAGTYLNNIRSLDPHDPEVQKNLVFLYLRREEWDRAVEAADKALENNPRDKDLLRMKASALYNLKDYEGLRKEYKLLYDQEPDNIETALAYAEILIGSHKSSEAEKVYERLLDRYPSERRIYRALIKVNERRLNIPGKRAVLHRMEKQFPDDKSISRDIAETFEQQKKWGEARAVYDSLMEVDGKSVELQKKIAQTYVEQDSLREAATLYDRLYKKNGEDKELILAFGKVLVQTGRLHKARTIYRDYLGKHPDKEVWYRLGKVQTELDQPGNAIKSFRSSLNHGSQDPDVYLQLSKLLAKGESGQLLDEARTKSREALTLSLELIREQQRKVEQQLSKRSLGNQVQNVRQFEKLERLNRLAKEAFAHFTDINPKERVVDTFEELEETYPGSGRLLYLIGAYYDNEGQVQRAKSYYQKSIRYTPQLQSAHLALARLFEQNGEYAASITSYERALSLDPRQSEPYDALIRLYRKQGKLDDLCDRWMSRYRADVDNEVLRNFLIEALHKAHRFKQAKKIINNQ